MSIITVKKLREALATILLGKDYVERDHALAALKASRRDAAWLADAMLDAAMPLVFDYDAHIAAMDLASKAVGLRDAITERIPAFEPEAAARQAPCGCLDLYPTTTGQAEGIPDAHMH